jgi:hypothetical protein
MALCRKIVQSKEILPVLTGITLVFLVAGCATVMHGTKQDIGVSSVPSGATVSIDNIPRGHTPVVASLSRKDNHTVKVESAGYQPFEATVTRSVSGWVAGNLVIGGLIGLSVDAISGGMYDLGPEQINATLVPLPQPMVSWQGEQQPVAFPLSTPQRVEQASVTPQTLVSQPVDRQLVAPLPPQAHKAQVNVVQLQSDYHASRLFLRPDTSAERLSAVYAGVNLKVLEERGAWLYIETPDDRRGWILREWLQ